MEDNKNKENNAIFTLKRMRPQDYDAWEFALEMWIRQRYNSCSDYFEKGKKHNYEMEPMDIIVDEYNQELDEIVKVAVLKNKYLQRGKVSKLMEKQKSNERLNEFFAKDCKAVVGLMHQYMDEGMKTALYSIKEYKDSLEENDIWKMKCTIKKLLRGQDRATIYKDIAYILACKPDGKTGERERFFKEFAKCVDKLLNRDDMTEAQILNCIINSIFVHGAQKIPQLREEVKKELIKQVWDDYSTLIIKWNEYCLTLDNMGWEEPGDKDHIQANYTELNKNKTNVESEEQIISILANKLYRLNNDGRPDSTRKQEIRTSLVNALQKKFVGHCWNCWALNEHSALNCPVKVKSICDECSGSHHTNACGLIINKKYKGVRKYKNSGNMNGKIKQTAIKKASMLVRNEDDEYSNMCIANILHQYEKLKDDLSDSASEDSEYINANTLNNNEESSSSEEDWDAGTRGNYKMKNNKVDEKLIRGFSLSVHNGNGSTGNKQSKSDIKKADAIKKLNDYKKELNDLEMTYENERKRIINSMRIERENIRASMPSDMIYKAGKVRIERVIGQAVDKHNRVCEMFNDKDVDGLIEMHQANMIMNNADDSDVERRKFNIECNVESWICNIDNNSKSDITKNIMSFVGKIEHVSDKYKKKNLDRMMNDQRRIMKLSSFKSPIREKIWSKGLDQEIERNKNDIGETMEEEEHDHNECTQSRLVNQFDQEYCSEVTKDKQQERNHNRGKPLHSEDILIETEEEEEERISKQYYEWEMSQSTHQVMEDYQNMSMRRARNRNQYFTPQMTRGRGNRRTSFEGNRTVNSDDREDVISHSGHRQATVRETRRRATKGEDGIYRDMSGKMLQQVSLITGMNEPVRTIEDLKRYYKYYYC